MPVHDYKSADKSGSNSSNMPKQRAQKLSPQELRNNIHNGGPNERSCHRNCSCFSRHYTRKTPEAKRCDRIHARRVLILTVRLC
mmetsp:Transcript_10795/g.40515  ORF Transcript_10795/g.40515 Transcript_10795/m.40515 type:complete len:84 (+) Transcript_10795:468-719(+)